MPLQTFYPRRDLRGPVNQFSPTQRPDQVTTLKPYGAIDEGRRIVSESLSRQAMQGGGLDQPMFFPSKSPTSTYTTGMVGTVASGSFIGKSSRIATVGSSLRRIDAEDSRLPPAPFVPAKPPPRATKNHPTENLTNPISPIQGNSGSLSGTTIAAVEKSEEFKNSLQERIHETLASLSKMCDAAGISKEELLSNQGVVELPKCVGHSGREEEVEDDYDDSFSGIKNSVCQKGLDSLSESRRDECSSPENPALNQLIEDISATITRKVLENLRKEFGTKSSDYAIDVEDGCRQRAFSYSSSLDARQVGPRSLSRRADVHTVGNIPSATDGGDNCKGRKTTTRPNIRTCEGISVSGMSWNIGRSSPMHDEIQKRHGAWIPPPRQMLYYDEHSPLFGKSPTRDETVKSVANEAKNSNPLGIQRSQSLSTSVTSFSSAKNPPCFLDECSNNESDSRSGNEKAPEQFFADIQDRRSVVTESRSSSHKLRRRRSCESSSTSASNRALFSRKGNRRDVLYTLRIETFQDNKQSSNGTGNKSNCLREVEVVRIHRHPDLFVMPDLLTRAECQSVRTNLWGKIAASEPSSLIKIQYGGVTAIDLYPKENGGIVEDNSIVGRILKRIFTVCRCKPSATRSLQLMEIHPQSLCEIARSSEGQSSQLVYIFLNDATLADGDETYFGAFGLKIKPQEGAALMWSHNGQNNSAIQRTSFKENVSVLLCHVAKST